MAHLVYLYYCTHCHHHFKWHIDAGWLAHAFKVKRATKCGQCGKQADYVSIEE